MNTPEVKQEIQDIMAAVKDHVRRCLKDGESEYHFTKIEEKLNIVIKRILDVARLSAIPDGELVEVVADYLKKFCNGYCEDTEYPKDNCGNWKNGKCLEMEKRAGHILSKVISHYETRRIQERNGIIKFLASRRDKCKLNADQITCRLCLSELIEALKGGTDEKVLDI